MIECPVCGKKTESAEGDGGRAFSAHLLNDHDEDDFGDVEEYFERRDEETHPLFDEPETEDDEPLAGVSA